MSGERNKESPVSAMWADLQKCNRLPKTQLLSSCESELQELMRQIDVMVQQKRGDWESEKRQLKARLEIREQEHRMTQQTLDNKHQEIGQLRSQLESAEHLQKQSAFDNEEQLRGLRDEVSAMKKDYERLQKKHSRQARDVQREKTKTSSELQDTQSNVKKMSAKVEEYRQRMRDAESEQRRLAGQLENSQSENSSLQEKCDLLQQQSTTYLSQLDRRREMLDNAETNLKSQITQLEGQLDRARDTVNSQDTQISRLKSSLTDTLAMQRKTLQDKEQIEKKHLTNQNDNKRLEEEMSHFHKDYDTQAEKLQLLQNDHTKLLQERTNLQNQLSEKHKTLEAQQQIDPQQQQQLQQQLQEAQQTIKKAEQKLHEREQQMAEFRQQLHTADQENLTLTQQLTEKMRQIREMESNDLRNLKEELAKLRKEQHTEWEQHTTETSQLREKLAEVTADLHQRNLAMASLTERAASMERQLRDQDEVSERKNAELEVSNAQLQALRLENRHLRRTALSLQNLTESDMSEAEKQLKDLQGAYATSMNSLQVDKGREDDSTSEKSFLRLQNNKLQEDVDQLRKELKKVDDSTQHRIQAVLRETEKTVESVKELENKRLEETRMLGRLEAANMQDKLNDTVSEYEDRIRNMRADMSSLENSLSYQIPSLKRIGLENNIMNNFVDGVDDIVKPSNDDTTGQNGVLDMLDDDDDFMLEPVEVVGARFYADQQERTKELAKKLDKHIEEFKSMTDATIKKYSLE